MKPIFNKEIEEIIHELFKEQNFLKEDYLSVMVDLITLYDETGYPGILFYMGESYYFGNNEFEKNEILGIQYLKNAADDGYLKAMDMLGEIYTSKALEALNKARSYYEQLTYVYDSSNYKLDLGTNLIASYLIDSSIIHYHEYDQYYTGLGLIAESFQRGNSEANIILNVLEKDKKSMDNYQLHIIESKNKIVQEMYSEVDLLNEE